MHVANTFWVQAAFHAKLDCEFHYRQEELFRHGGGITALATHLRTKDSLVIHLDFPCHVSEELMAHLLSMLCILAMWTAWYDILGIILCATSMRGAWEYVLSAPTHKIKGPIKSRVKLCQKQYLESIGRCATEHSVKQKYTVTVSCRI